LAYENKNNHYFKLAIVFTSMAIITVFLSVLLSLQIYEKLNEEEASCIQFNLK